MPQTNAAVTHWIRQMADPDQVVAYHAYQCLQEEVFRLSRPGEENAQAALARVLGEALVARPKAGQAARGRGQARLRSNLARLLGYLPNETAALYLAKAMSDLEAREMVRMSLESNPSERATEALLAGLDSADPVFRAGVIHSLAKRRGEKVISALRAAAADRQAEVRLAALLALADFPEPSHDEILAKAAGSASPEERRTAFVARVRLAATLQASGNTQAAGRILKAVLASDAPEPQKKAARLALG